MRGGGGDGLPTNWPSADVFHDSIRIIRGSKLKEYPLPPVQRTKICLKHLPRSHPAYRSEDCLGVFATASLKKGDVIGYYAGILRPDWAVPFNAYVARTVSNHLNLVWDAFNGGNEMRFINSNRGIVARPNVVMGKEESFEGAPRWVVAAPIIALRNIKAGEELLLDYGEEYWESLRAFEAELQQTYNPQRVEPILASQAEGALVEVDMDQIDLKRVFGEARDDLRTSLCQGTLVSLAGDMAEVSLFGRQPICIHRSALFPPRSSSPIESFAKGDRVEVLYIDKFDFEIGWWSATVNSTPDDSTDYYCVTIDVDVGVPYHEPDDNVPVFRIRTPSKNRPPPRSFSQNQNKKRRRL